MENRPYSFKQQILKSFEDNRCCSSDALEAVTVKWVFTFTFVYRADGASQNVGWNVFKGPHFMDEGIENLLYPQSEEGSTIFEVFRLETLLVSLPSTSSRQAPLLLL